MSEAGGGESAGEAGGGEGGRSVYVTADDGLRLHARIYEAAHAEPCPVVCLHGLARTSLDFHELALALSTGSRPRRVVCPDLRGRGLSARDPDPRHYDVRVEMRDVLATLTALGVSEAIFVGTSRGGLITMALAAARPAIVKAAALVDIGPVVETDGLRRIRGYVGKLPSPGSFEEAAELLRSMQGSQFPALDAEDWMRLARRTWMKTDAGLQTVYDPALMQGLAELNLDAPLPTLWPLFEALSPVLTLVLRGETSDILSAATAQDMEKHHPGCRVVTVPGQGHAPLFWREEAQAPVRAFIDALAREDDRRAAA